MLQLDLPLHYGVSGGEFLESPGRQLWHHLLIDLHVCQLFVELVELRESSLHHMTFRSIDLCESDLEEDSGSLVTSLREGDCRHHTLTVCRIN